MAVTSASLSTPARLVTGLWVLAVGVTAACFTWEQFRILPAEDKSWGWVFPAVGVLTALVGGRLLVRGSPGKVLLLAGPLLRIVLLTWGAAIMFSVFFLYLVFGTDPAGSRGYLILPACSAGAMALCARGLFNVTTPPEQPLLRDLGPRARQRAPWLVPVLFLASAALMLLGVAGEIWDTGKGNPQSLSAGILVGIAAAVYALLTWGSARATGDDGETHGGQ